MRETQTKTTPTQLVLGTEHSYVITTCIIHVHFVNLGKPGAYTTGLNKMLKANGLPTVIAPSDVPSEELFGAKIAKTVSRTVSR